VSGIEEVAAIAALAGTAVSAAAAIQQGQQAKAAGEYNAQVDANNAKVAADAAAAQEQQKALETNRLIGTEKAVAAASGVDPSSGSPLAVMSDTASRGTLDALRIRYQGQLGVNADTSDAAMQRYTGAQAAAGGFTKAGATVLTGASNYMYQTSRSPNGTSIQPTNSMSGVAG
jgi:hypothetical protein